MKLSIITVNYNTKKLVYDCVKSIISSKPNVSYEIIVVDNGSKEKLSKSNDYKLIENGANLGFSKGVNVGIKAAKGDYILILNSDTKVLKGSIDELIEFAEVHPDAGAVGPRLINEDGSVQSSVYHFPTMARAIREFWFGERGVYEKYLPEGKDPLAVDAVVMAAFLITPRALKKVGLLNEKYFLYFEDLDFSREIKRANLRVYYDPKSEVEHVHGASGKSLADEKNQWRRLVPSSKIYHGVFMHSLINFILWSGQKFGKLIPIFLVALLTIPAFSRLVRPGFFPMQDDLQAFRVYEMDKCYTDLQIPCRWVPDAGYEYGYPQFNFYPPLPYYIGAALHRVWIQYIDSVKVLFVVGYILSAITLFILVDSLVGSWAGIVASALYTYIPYKAVEVYVRGALSEFWAQIFFPLIFWASYKLIKTGKAKYFVWLSVSSAMLLTTHTLMSMIFVPIVAVWAIYWFIEVKWKNFIKVLASAVLGFGLSAFFTLPVLFERKFAHVESLLSGYFDYRQHFVSLYKLFLSMEWGYGSSGFPNEKLNLSTGIPQWIIGLVVVPILGFFALRKKKKWARLSLIIAAVEVFVLFMMHVRSSFIWAKIPALWYLQFPWRFLAVSIFLLCVLSGFAIYFSGKYKYALGAIFILVSFVLYFPFFIPKDWLNISDKEKFSGTSWEKQLTISIFDYLPIYATLPPWAKAPDLPEVLEGNVKFVSYNKGSDFQNGALDASTNSLIRLPLFDFPGMQVKIDNQIVSHINNDCRQERYCLGLITFRVPAGKHDIEAKLTDTPIRSAGNIVTLVSFVLLVSGVLRLKKDEKVFS